MVQISSDFAPPLRIIAPFFIAGTLFYGLSIAGLLCINNDISWLDLHWIGLVHTYLIGFVMMIIIGALAQLLPVVLEKGHCCVGFYPIIFTFITAGTVLLFLGFWLYPLLLSYGGLIIMLGFAIFGVEVVLTGKKDLLRNLSTRSMGYAVFFMLIGSLIGWIMTLGLAGTINSNPTAFIDVHAITMLGGTVMMIVIGITQILLPMFGLAHGFKNTPSIWAVRMMAAGISVYWIGKMLSLDLILFIGAFFIVLSVLAYVLQVILIARKKARKEFDIWFRSLVVAYVSLFLALVSLVAVGYGNEKGWILFGWLFGVGFLGFMITGHLYKIIPFLVWFDRYSPLVGKQKVPMLHQMVPKKSADFQWGYSAIGMFTVALSLILNNSDLWHGGLSFLLIGSVFLIRNVFWMLRFK
ncbi:hypothetical protein [Sulfuricurvum sp.]|uniref:hypothetical protein n=1 Tax=Sulfuricurvum sp. TaxID=2025608 RepID=UPI0026166FC3|nr:hypothetical protein [Sulfuricurvum sp.]MDD2267138.1 hypothetical protein [Sulfuricurvum sp.]